MSDSIDARRALTECAEDYDKLYDKHTRLLEALESHVRGLDAMKRLISEGRGASGKLEDIRTAIIYERANAVAALQEACDE